jgi:hypothetical protein
LKFARPHAADPQDQRFHIVPVGAVKLAKILAAHHRRHFKDPAFETRGEQACHAVGQSRGVVSRWGIGIGDRYARQLVVGHACSNRLAQHNTDNRSKGGCIHNFARKSIWSDAGAVQHLAHIDISQPCHDALIQQRRFDGRLAPRQFGRQIWAIKGIAQWFWPKARQQRVRFGPFCFH